MVRNHLDGCPYLNLSLFFWRYTETSIFLVKLVCQWVPDRDGRGITRNIKKKLFILSKLNKKMVTKLGQLTKLGPFSTFQLFKLSKLCYHFLSSFGKENIFFYIPSNPPPIGVRNSLTNQFSKRLTFLYIFNNNKKVQNWNVEKGPE